jgi:hypothetical protein
MHRKTSKIQKERLISDFPHKIIKEQCVVLDILLLIEEILGLGEMSWTIFYCLRGRCIIFTLLTYNLSTILTYKLLGGGYGVGL